MYFDTAYIAKLYLKEADSGVVRALAEDAGEIVCSAHGRVELAYIFHHKFREAAIDREDFTARWKQVEADSAAGNLRWLPWDDSLVDLAARSALDLPSNLFLRAAGALHLVCARDHGFRSVYSNDKHLLAAAKHFRLRGINVTAPPT
jgi:predicted nucleic acid-binding protein